MKIKQVSEYKIVSTEDTTTIFHGKDLRKQVRLVKTNNLRGVRRISKTEKKTPKVLLPPLPSRQLVKITSARLALEATSKRVRRPKITQKERVRLELLELVREIASEMLKGE